MSRKAARAGVPVSGVPVLDVMGKLILGFDPGEVERQLRAN